LFICALGILFCLSVHAEDLLQAAQRELRARKFYFGEIDARASVETTAAIKRFQTSKGIDSTGKLDGETIRALGLPLPKGCENAEERRSLDASCACVLQYFQARESGEWKQLVPTLAESVSFYSDEELKRDALREILDKENRRWPHRKYTMLNRIASLVPDNHEVVQVTVRIHTRVENDSGQSRTETEDLIFRLRKSDDGWRIAMLKLLE
jgi:hypothetical protein